MIFSACRINRECREKIPTKINNKQDIVTCWDFCRSLVRLVSQHNTYKCTNHQKHGYLNHNEHVPWTDSKGYVQGENIEGFQALDDEQILLYMITDGIWNVYSVENGPVSHVWNSSFHFWPESSMIWLQRKWKNDGFSMPLKLFVQVPTDNCCPFSPFLSAMINNYLKKRPFWIATCMCENVWWLNYSPI